MRSRGVRLRLPIGHRAPNVERCGAALLTQSLDALTTSAPLRRTREQREHEEHTRDERDDPRHAATRRSRSSSTGR
jgi:hypothetical protein